MRLALRLRASSKFFTDDSLTKKASLNALASVLDYGARLFVGFLITPLLVTGLGQYFFGTWQVLNRLLAYISPASGRPTQALKFTIARDQYSTNLEEKQKYVGSALIVWVLFVPFMIVLGALLVWQVPYWLKTPPEYFLQVRVCIGILVANLAITGVTTIPMSVLQGENLGYKRMGLTTATVLLGGGLVWLALYLDTGLVGVGASALITTILTGIVFFKITRMNAKWFRISFPSFRQTRQFLGLSIWFQGWNLVMKLMTASDVVLLGFLISAEAVTGYTLSKYAPETLISVIAMVIFGMAPGLGGIIGSGQYEKAARIRGEIMALTWLLATALGATILVWNRTFLMLWVGPGHYVGPVATFFILLVITQFVLIRSDAVIIDLSLDLRRKILIGFISSAVAIVVSGLLVGYFKLGVIGLCLGLIAGRMLLTVGYPSIVARFLGIDILSQLRSSVRPALVTILLFLCATWLGGYINLDDKTGFIRWINLIFGAGMSAGVFLVTAFYFGLSAFQRQTILKRLRAMNTSGYR
jgi:O-antigen/teichoic acid export membrane protein